MRRWWNKVPLVLLIVAICLAPLFSFLWIQKSRLMFVRLTVSPGNQGDEFRPRVVEDASTPFVGGKVYDIDASGSEVKFPAGYLQRFREVGISVVSVTDTKGNQYEPYEGIHVQFEKSSGVGSDPLADPHFALYYRYKQGPKQ